MAARTGNALVRVPRANDGSVQGRRASQRFCGSKRSPIEIKALFQTPLKTAVGPAWLNAAHTREVQTCPKQQRFRSRPLGRGRQSPADEEPILCRCGGVRDSPQRCRVRPVVLIDQSSERAADVAHDSPRRTRGHMASVLPDRDDSGSHPPDGNPSPPRRRRPVHRLRHGCGRLPDGDRPVTAWLRSERRLRRAAFAPGSPPLAREEFAALMLPPLLGFANFGILTGLGLAFRHRPAVHKRLMLLALGLLVLTPLLHLSGHLIGRWPGLYGALNLAIFIAANALPFSVAVHDKVSDGRVHPISLWVPVLLIVETFGLIAVVMPSEGWRQLAMWLVS